MMDKRLEDSGVKGRIAGKSKARRMTKIRSDRSIGGDDIEDARSRV